MSGLKRNDLVGKKCHQMMHGSFFPPFSCPLKHLIDTGGFEREEMEMEALGRNFLVSCSPVFNKENQLINIIHIATDITNTKNVQKELNKKVRENDLLLDIIQHDLGNIHQGTSSFIKLALSTDGEKKNDLLRSALETSLRAQRLIKNLKNIEKLKKGSQTLRKRNILKILKNSMKTAALLHPEKEPEIKLNTELRSVSAMGNSMLDDLFVNLIDNCIKYGSPQKNEVSIQIKDGKDTVTIFIMDTGPGIPKDSREMIFDRNIQLDNENKQGSGLGLLICKRIIEEIGAEISVIDRPDGNDGACFKVDLPKGST
jgi:K+-sensing histidine kinase KdpD